MDILGHCVKRELFTSEMQPTQINTSDLLYQPIVNPIISVLFSVNSVSLC